jgi:YVTN family beta-propeller protein
MVTENGGTGSKDPATLTPVTTIPLGKRPRGIAASPDGTRLYVALSGSPDAGPGVDESKLPAFLPDGSRAYVPSENGATLTVIDVKRLRPLRTIKLAEGMRPMGTAVAPDGKHLYVTTGRSKMVLVLDTATNQITGSVEAGPRPWGIAVAPDGTALYTANGPSNDVSVIDVATSQVTKKIAVGTGPWGLAVVKRSASR